MRTLAVVAPGDKYQPGSTCTGREARLSAAREPRPAGGETLAQTTIRLDELLGLLAAARRRAAAAQASLAALQAEEAREPSVAPRLSWAPSCASRF